MTDKELVARKIALISQDLDELKSIGRKTVSEFLADKIERFAAERLLERMIGRMIDINFHVLTDTGQAPPPDYFQSFVKLGELGALPADFARQIAPCAGLRNRLIHEYDEIDPDKLFAGLQTAVRDIPVYLEHIAKLVE